MSDPTNINFWTAKNYMKRDVSTGSQNVAAPVTSEYLGLIFVTRTVITHNLGFVPYFSVFYEPFKDGVIWEPLGTRNGQTVNNPRNTAVLGPYCIAWPTTTTLTVEIGYKNNTLTGTYPIYYIIYKDYGIA